MKFREKFVLPVIIELHIESERCFMSTLEKFYSVVIFISVMIGFLIGRVDGVNGFADSMIVPLLMIMLYMTFLQIPLKDIASSFKNYKFTLSAVVMNFVWTPLLAFGLALLLLQNHPALWIGFIMLMVTPCTDWYLIFTGIAKGNVALSTAILPLNLVLQIVLLPLYLWIFSSATGVINIRELLSSVFIVLIVPLALSLVTRRLILKKGKVRERVFEKIESLPILFLALAIIAMFASQGNVLLDHLNLLLIIIVPIVLFFIINLIVSQFVGGCLKFSYQDNVSLSMTTLARNSPIALAIAMTAFPDEPLVALVLVVGPLMELPILAVIAQILLRKRCLNL